MKYFRAKEVVIDNTTLSLHASGMEKVICYHSDENFNYYGIETEDAASILSAQPVEIEATELTYAEIKPKLDNCRMMQDFNTMIEEQIAEKYSVGREFKMRDLPTDDPERVEYEAFKETVKAPIRVKKQELGLLG